MATTVFFCVPLGLVSLYYSTQVNRRWLAGEYVAAVEAGTRAKRWAWAAAFTGVFVYGVVLLTIASLRAAQG